MCSKKFNLAQWEVLPLPLASGKQALSTWHVLSDKSVFVYLGPWDTANRSALWLMLQALGHVISAPTPQQLKTEDSQPHLYNQAPIKTLDTKAQCYISTCNNMYIVDSTICALLHTIPGGVHAVHNSVEGGQLAAPRCELSCTLLHVSRPFADFRMFLFAIINSNHEYNSFQ